MNKLRRFVINLLVFIGIKHAISQIKANLISSFNEFWVKFYRIEEPKRLLVPLKNQERRSSYKILNSEKVPFWNDIEVFKLASYLPITKKNSILLGRGIILDENKSIVLESNIFQRQYLTRLEQTYLLAIHFLLPSRKIRKAIVLSNFLDNNYYHWVLESLGRLVMLPENYILSDYKFIVSSGKKNYVNESLECLFSIEKENLIESQNLIKYCIDDCVIPIFPFYTGDRGVNIYDHDVMKRLNLIAKKTAKKLENKINIIISRKGATQRRILNPELIKESFIEFSFKEVYLEHLSFQDQIDLFYNSNIIIATHGAGMVNTIFSDNPIIIELCPSSRFIKDAYYFKQISDSLCFQHFIVRYDTDCIHEDCTITKNLLDHIGTCLNRNNLTF
jgi:hypothetical protein